MTSKLIQPNFSNTNHSYVAIVIFHENLWSLIIAKLKTKTADIYFSNKLSEDGIEDIKDCMKDIFSLYE